MHNFHDLSLNVFVLFFLECVGSSIKAFLSFCALAFVRFLFYSKDAFFIYLIFLAISDSHETLHVALGLFGMPSIDVR